VTLLRPAGVCFGVHGKEPCVAFDLDTYYRTYGPMVLRRCRQLLRDEEKAVDAMHDVFVELARRRDRLEDAAPAALLQRVATNVCLNKLRSTRRRPEESAEDELLLRIAQAGELDAENRCGVRSLLGRIFDRETESTRAIAVMHLLDGMTLEEVAAEVGLSVSGVRKRLRGLKARVAELEVV
jgi:RNA polymerase sigma factor (sigma-70 family)